MLQLYGMPITEMTRSYQLAVEEDTVVIIQGVWCIGVEVCGFKPHT